MNSNLQPAQRCTYEGAAMQHLQGCPVTILSKVPGKGWLNKPMWKVRFDRPIGEFVGVRGKEALYETVICEAFLQPITNLQIGD